MTGDNAIQYIFAQKEEDIAVGVKEKGAASIQIALISMMLTLTLLLSPFRVINYLGIVFFSGLFLSLVGDLWLLRYFLERKASGR